MKRLSSDIDVIASYLIGFSCVVVVDSLWAFFVSVLYALAIDVTRRHVAGKPCRATGFGGGCVVVK